MGFLKKLFGGGSSSKPYVDTQGLYFYARCDNCQTIVRVRADKQHDLNRSGDGFTWHKTIVDSKCFRRMQALVHLNSHYQVTNSELSHGQFVTEADYKAWLDAPDPSEES